jgi:hypothetical protein
MRSTFTALWCLVAVSALPLACPTSAYEAVSVAPKVPRSLVPLKTPLDRGVCTHVIVRAFRAAQVDLQKEIHEDMRRAFAQYPQKWDHAAQMPTLTIAACPT